MLKYNHQKLASILLEEYREKYGTAGNPSSTINKLIECMDDAFVDEWAKDVSAISEEINREATDTLNKANNALKMLRAGIQENEDSYNKAKEAEAVHDERVADALKAYQTIVNMEFDTPQQTLQNIQNASYFIWALYFQAGDNPANMYFKDIKDGEISDVKKEDDESNKYKGVPIR